MKSALGALVAVFLVVTTGCAHAVQIKTTPPGAEISVDGQKVGTSPATFQHSSSGAGTITVKATYQGKEVTKQVPKDQLAWDAIGAGAGIGVAGCCALSAAATVAGFFVGIFATPITCLACGSLVAGPAVAFVMYGNRPQDQINLDLTKELGPDAPVASDPSAPPAPPPPTPEQVGGGSASQSY
jgi:hypothetical protein